MKERYRRIPIELIISSAYEDRPADARFVLLSLIVSPRQTPPGVYDGGLKALEYETALPVKRLKAALRELEAARLIEPVSTGGWWVVDTFRAQCCNRDYSRAAIRHLTERWPELLAKFKEVNHSILSNPKYSPQTGDTPSTDPPQSPSVAGKGSVAVPGTETGSGAGAAPKPPPATDSDAEAGGRGFQGEGGSASASAGALKPPLASIPPQNIEKGNGMATPSCKGKTVIQAAAITAARACIECGEWTHEKAIEKLIKLHGFDQDTALSVLSKKTVQ